MIGSEDADQRAYFTAEKNVCLRSLHVCLLLAHFPSSSYASLTTLSLDLLMLFRIQISREMEETKEEDKSNFVKTVRGEREKVFAQF